MKNIRSASLYVAALLVAGGCAGKHSRNEDGPFQGPQTSEGTQPVTVEREVVRTEKVQTEIPTVVETNRRADINRMEPEHFRALGFPSEVAQNTVRYRNEHGGRFGSVDELHAVPGMTDDLFNRVKDRLGVNATG